MTAWFETLGFASLLTMTASEFVILRSAQRVSKDAGG